MSVENLTNDSLKLRSWTGTTNCAVCGAKAIGINFGAPTCAPCKAFFRRNVRRREVLKLPCHIIGANRSAADCKDQNNNPMKPCSQLRRCTSCRLRRCLEIGMKEELVRTEEEKLRYRQLIQSNRQRRIEAFKSKRNLQMLPSVIVSTSQLLDEKDWTYLSNIVAAYDNYCLKTFRDNRQQNLLGSLECSDPSLTKVYHHTSARVNNISSFLLFLSTIPLIRSLSYVERYYLSKHNLRSLIFLNSYEINQTCFTEPWQTNADNEAAERVYGRELYLESLRMRQRAEAILINDPVITRLWLITLFFSSPLFCDYEQKPTTVSNQMRRKFSNLQNTFCTLLWSYLLHRHGSSDTIRIFSNTIGIYLRMQRLSSLIGQEVRTRDELNILNQMMNQIILLQKPFGEEKKANELTV